MMKKLALITGALMVSTTSLAAKLDKDEEKLGYTLGYKTAENIQTQGIVLDPSAFLDGFNDGFKGKVSAINNTDMEKILVQQHSKQIAKQEEARKDMANKNMASSKQFLDQHKAQKDVKVLASGLQYKVLENKGKGKSPTMDDFVQVHYEGKLINGDIFDSSLQRKEPIVFPVKGVIQGWQEALQMMKPGDIWEVVLPPELAYGEYGAPPKIQPNSTLIFEIRLLSVLDEKEAQEFAKKSGQ